MRWNRAGWVALIGLASAVASAAGEADAKWPAIVPRSAEFVVNSASSDIVDWVIENTHADALYRVRCRGPGEDAGFTFSGDWECRLVPVHEKARYSSLFLHDPAATRDWQSRARFFAEQMTEPCSAIDGYGRTRSFRLRGMKISLEVVEPVTKKNHIVGTREQRAVLHGFRFRMRVENDPSAAGEIAEPIPAPRLRTDQAACAQFMWPKP